MVPLLRRLIHCRDEPRAICRTRGSLGRSHHRSGPHACCSPPGKGHRQSQRHSPSITTVGTRGEPTGHYCCYIEAAIRDGHAHLPAFITHHLPGENCNFGVPRTSPPHAADGRSHRLVHHLPRFDPIIPGRQRRTIDFPVRLVDVGKHYLDSSRDVANFVNRLVHFCTMIYANETFEMRKRKLTQIRRREAALSLEDGKGSAASEPKLPCSLFLRMWIEVGRAAGDERDEAARA
ncbi:hypothetical protein BDZ85DRAFT_133564 [Elsinoe ampelina]|uniref:Uncharacterized protein n=1 Tax=Elsinoe ampelina TaxID=302913 RepID=A0A6A6G7X9_9PEZI|nr:hypothetical protein BDZ85DRAFT_133564 [Elsinoe ampelina]